jgi:hypothetical protein
LKLLEKQGRHNEAAEFRSKLKKAMVSHFSKRLIYQDAKLQLERVSKINFNKPDKEMKESAVKFGLDLSDPLVQQELNRLKNENQKELQDWSINTRSF